MVTDEQARLLMKLINKEQRVQTAAAKAGMSEKTARRYRRLGRLVGILPFGLPRRSLPGEYDVWGTSHLAKV